LVGSGGAPTQQSAKGAVGDCRVTNASSSSGAGLRGGSGVAAATTSCHRPWRLRPGVDAARAGVGRLLWVCYQ